MPQHATVTYTANAYLLGYSRTYRKWQVHTDSI